MITNDATVELTAVKSFINVFETLLELLEAEQPIILNVQNKELYEIILLSHATSLALKDHLIKKYN
jgi:hypothetical protein